MSAHALSWPVRATMAAGSGCFQFNLIYSVNLESGILSTNFTAFGMPQVQN